MVGFGAEEQKWLDGCQEALIHAGARGNRGFLSLLLSNSLIDTSDIKLCTPQGNSEVLNMRAQQQC